MNSLLTQNTNAETSTETFSEPKEKGTDLSDKEGTSFHNLKTIKKKSTVSGSVVPSDKSVSVSFFERKKVPLLDAPKKPKRYKKVHNFSMDIENETEQTQNNGDESVEIK